MYTVVSVLCSVCSKVMQSVGYTINVSGIPYGFISQIKRSYTISGLQYRRRKYGDLYCRSRNNGLPQLAQFVKLRFPHYWTVGLPANVLSQCCVHKKLLVLTFFRKNVTCLNVGLLKELSSAHLL